MSAVRHAAPDQKVAEALQAAELNNKYVGHVVPPGPVRDLFEIGHIDRIAGIEF